MPTKKYLKRIKGWRTEGNYARRKKRLEEEKYYALKYGKLRGRPT